MQRRQRIEDLCDIQTIGLKDLKIQLGLIKKVRPKKDNPLAPYKQMARKPELYNRGKQCQFNSETMQAYSYGWWRFVEKVGNYVVFNNYRYSHSTSKHQSDTIVLMDRLDIKIDFFFECRGGFQAGYQTAIDDYNYEIKELKKLIKTPGTHKAKNEQRKTQIAEIQATLGIVKRLDRLKKASNE